MKTLFTVFMLLAAFTAFSQSKTEMLTKKWKITAYETFGVKEDLKDNQKKDYLEFKADKTFIGIENGVEVSGTWQVEKTNVYLFTTNAKTKEKRNYKIYSVSEKEALIEYKDATLIKTKYYMIAE